MQKMSILAALVTALVASQGNAEIGEVNVTGGRVAGVAADSVVSFKGIPFAAPPGPPSVEIAPTCCRSWSGSMAAHSRPA